MTPNTTTRNHGAGIDVSKKKLDLFLITPKGEREKTFPNSEAGIAQLVRAAKGAQIATVEPTATFHRPLVRALHEARIPIALPNPRKARDFARSRPGAGAKSDSVDARALAQYGLCMNPELHTPPSPAQEELAAYCQRRLELTEMRTAEENRLHEATLPKLRKCHQDAIDLYNEQIAYIKEAMEAIVGADEEARRRVAILDSAPGVGRDSAIALQALLPELGLIDGNQLAALVGVAPIVRESGQWKGRAMIQGGRKEPRCVVYMCTLSAIRCNPPIKEFYKRLRAQGKPRKVAMIAAARKLLLQLNAMVRNNEHYKAP